MHREFGTVRREIEERGGTPWGRASSPEMELGRQRDARLGKMERASMGELEGAQLARKIRGWKRDRRSKAGAAGHTSEPSRPRVCEW